ncbi:FliG C-terminal domain-containing protein [Candidatus Latescibacterota bacterium]
MSSKHYRLLSKQLLKALKDGDREAAERVSAHLPRLSGRPADEVLAADVGLQEAQHVIAREHGHRQWADLPGVDGVEFEDLLRLSDDEIRALLRRLKRRDIVIVLKQLEQGGDTPEHQVYAALMRIASSELAWERLQEDAQLFTASAEDAQRAQQRIEEQAGRLGEAGVIDWPPGSGSRAATPKPQALPQELQLMAQPLDALSPLQLRQLMHGLAATAEADGMLPEEALAPALAECATEYFARGVKYVVDGTEPDLILDLLETRAQTLVRYQETRERMIIEGMAAIASGDNPRIVQHKVSTLYAVGTEPETEPRAPEGTAALVMARLADRPASGLSLHDLVELLGDIAWISRRSCAACPEGLGAVLPLADAVDEPLLASGLRRLAGLEEARNAGEEPLRDGWEAMVRELEQEMDVRLGAARLRYALVAAGLTALGAGKRGEELDAALDSAVS